MTNEERITLIQLALGQVSLAFMTQPEGFGVVMPTRELLECAKDLAELWGAEIRELRKDKVKLAIAANEVNAAAYKVQDWGGTRLGDALDAILAALAGEESKQ